MIKYIYQKLCNRIMKIAFMLEFRVFVKNLRLTQRLIDYFLVNALGSMINDSFMISIAYFGSTI